MTWTRITSSEEAAELLPTWFGSRMIGVRGKFGLLLTTGDVLKITSIAALHQSSCGTILLDVLLDHAGAPEAIDLAWQPKHYLGAPVPGATMATINLSHVVGAVEFVAEAMVEQPDDETTPAQDAAEPAGSRFDTLSETIERANAIGT